MSPQRRMEYALADKRIQFRIAAENPAKMTRLGELLESYPGARILIIGEYIAQIEAIAGKFRVPLVAGRTPQPEREEIYDRFRGGALRCIARSPKSETSRSTSPRPTFSFRFPARSVPARKKPSDSDEFWSKGRRPRRPFLHARLPRHPRRRIRTSPQAFSGRTGILISGCGLTEPTLPNAGTPRSIPIPWAEAPAMANPKWVTSAAPDRAGRRQRYDRCL